MKENNAELLEAQAVDILPFKAVIFDMDGTLLESTEADYKAWEKVFNDYGKALSFADYVPLLGIKSANVIKEHLEKTEAEDVKRILKEKFDYFVEWIEENPIQPVLGAEAFLKSLANYPVQVALATSSRKEKMHLVLTQLNFKGFFEAIVTGDEVINSKPAPDIFLKAAERLGVAPEDCMVVEDGPVGVAAAKAAGMKCVAITATHPAEKLQQADLIINTYENADFKEICERLSAV
ncbi:MAG TPA: HAD family phosphatase [Segetibacter sp.]|jgi:beta-phosphoglucomutase family hydrolase